MDGHSTGICGIIAGREGTDVIGVAPQARLYIAKALDDKGICSMGSLTKAVFWCIEMKVDIIVMSLGAPSRVFRSARKLKKSVKAAHAANIAIFAAAGNTGKTLDIPARWKEVYSVGAIDFDGEICDFSARGVSMDFCGYGHNIFSTYLNNQYATISGTSAAVPGVAGVAALVLSEFPGITPDELRGKMIAMCRDHDVEGWDANTGWGIPIYGIEGGHLIITTSGLVDEDEAEDISIFTKIKKFFF